MATADDSGTAPAPSRRRRGVPAHKEGREGADGTSRPGRPAVEPVVPDEPAAARIVAASWIGTGLLTVTALPGAVAPDVFIAPAVFTAVALFVAGIAAFLWAYAVAIGRSRTDLIGIGGLFFLAGSAPQAVQRQLLASFGVQIAVALIAASTRVFTPLAFEVLAPMYGLGLMGLWGAKFGTFPPRPPVDRPGKVR